MTEQQQFNHTVAARNALLAKLVPYNRAQQEGITIQGITLAAGDKDRSLFSQMLVLLREAEDLLSDESARIAFRASPQTIADAQGGTHTMTVTELRGLLVAYGAAYQALWTAAQQS